MNSSFISCDWGTSSFRLRLVAREAQTIQHQVERAQGIKDVFSQSQARSLSQRENAFAKILGEAADALLSNRSGHPPKFIFLSGMASSSIGWKELPYTPLPFPLTGKSLIHTTIPITTPDQRSFQVVLLSGVASKTEIMRGEECELIGISTLPKLADAMKDCLVVLPGTHSKHVTIKEGEITAFHTVMTGELFDTISKHTLLSASLAPPKDQKSHEETQGEEEAFRAGVESARDPGFARSLFQIRTRAVLHKQSPESNHRFLSGLLIGSEWLSILTHNHSVPIVLAAGTQFSNPYQTAAKILGSEDRVISLSADEVTRAAVRGHATLLENKAADL